MLSKQLHKFALAFGLAALWPMAALANEVDNATVNATCTGYTLSASGKNLEASHQYEVKYWFGVKLPDGTVADINGSLPVQSQDNNGDFNASQFEGWGPLPAGKYSFTYGHATLFDDTSGQQWNSAYITFSPKCYSCQKMCSTQTQDPSNFNGTAINPGTYIWFNSNLKGLNIPSGGGTLYFSNQTITFTAGGQNYTLPVPNAQIVFSTTATCTSTSFDSQTNTWVTTVPIKGDDEIFLSGLSYLVPAGFGKVQGSVTWNGTFSTPNSGIGAQWKWGAAVYTQFTQDYNKLVVKAGHQTSCQIQNGDHAGTPEGTDAGGVAWKTYVTGGARGGGGSNFTGSWSGTISSKPVCN